jgi:hypothetical protein
MLMRNGEENKVNCARPWQGILRNALAPDQETRTEGKALDFIVP